MGARSKDLLTTPYVFNEAEAEGSADAGADIIVLPSRTDDRGGAIGAKTALKLGDCPALIDAWAAAALRARPDILDPLRMAGRSRSSPTRDFIPKNTKTCHGFYGASSMERLPVERALTEQVRSFKAIGRRSVS